MKILAINSSFRGSKGFSKFLIDKLFEGAREKGADCETINLSELKINHCIDCQVCQKPEHFLKCVFNDKDDFAMIYDKMKEADLIIYASPVYTFGMSSLLKTLFERFYSKAKVGEFKLTKSGLFFHHVDNDISSKPFAVLVVCDNLEDEMTHNTLSFFRTYSKFNDVEPVGTLVRKSAAMFGFNEKKENNSLLISEVYDAYVQAGRELASLGKVCRKTEKKANQPMVKIPFFVKPMMRFGFGREKILEGHHKIMNSAIKRA